MLANHQRQFCGIHIPPFIFEAVSQGLLNPNQVWVWCLLVSTTTCQGRTSEKCSSLNGADIAKEMNISRDKGQRLLRELCSKGFAKKVGDETAIGGWEAYAVKQ